MRAYHKYKHLANSGNREAQRRIAQSMGYRHTIYDDQNMIALMYRAGIELLGVDYTNAKAGKTDFVEDYSNKAHVADLESINI